MKVAIIGAGAFGRAMHIVAQAGGEAALLGRKPAPDVIIAWDDALAEAELVAMAVPAQATREALIQIAPRLRPEPPHVPLRRA